MQRTIFHLPGLTAARDALERDFAEQVASRFEMDFRLTEAAKPKRVGILASKEDHCLLDLLWRNRRGELDMSVSMVISNHPDLADQVRPFGVPFLHVPATKDIRAEAEQRQLDLLRGNVDLVVLARYMQILSQAVPVERGLPVDQHPPLVPARVHRRCTVPAGQGAGREAGGGDRALRHRRTRRRTDHRARRGESGPPALRRGPDAARRGRRAGGACRGRCCGTVRTESFDTATRPSSSKRTPAQYCVEPWSTDIACAVTSFDSSLASQHTASAMSSGWATQFGRNGVSMFISA